MCELSQDFKLCSCDGEALTDPDWVLQRLDPSKSPHHRRGRAMLPRFNEREQAQQALILASLNDGRCFDFPYTPVSGDVLRLKAAGRNLRFRHDGRTWTVDTSTALTGWRAQMVPHHRGTVD